MQRPFLAILATLVILAITTTTLAQDAAPADEATAINTTADEATSGDDAVAAAKSAPPVADAVGPARAKWDQAFGQWKGILSDLRDIQTEFQLAEKEAMAGLDERWKAKIAEGKSLIADVRTAAIAAQQESPNNDRELTRFLIKMMEDEIANDSYENADSLGKALIETNIDDKSIHNLAGIAAFATSQFDRALELLETADGAGALNAEGSNFLDNMRSNPNLSELWEKELELRAAESTAEEAELLPRVKMVTTEGEFVLELFENEAPETVGNFINLVEKGYYDNLNFHRVLHGFMAQGGCPQGDGGGSPGYKIYCECVSENHRNHWRGSVSMAKTAARNTGGSQFFFNFVPTPHLNGEHTVFGRIVEGLENLPKIHKRDPDKPNEPATKIIKAEVVRKRAHEYVPNKVQ